MLCRFCDPEPLLDDAMLEWLLLFDKGNDDENSSIFKKDVKLLRVRR